MTTTDAPRHGPVSPGIRVTLTCKHLVSPQKGAGESAPLSALRVEGSLRFPLMCDLRGLPPSLTVCPAGRTLPCWVLRGRGQAIRLSDSPRGRLRSHRWRKPLPPRPAGPARPGPPKGLREPAASGSGPPGHLRPRSPHTVSGPCGPRGGRRRLLRRHRVRAPAAAEALPAAPALGAPPYSARRTPLPLTRPAAARARARHCACAPPGHTPVPKEQ